MATQKANADAVPDVPTGHRFADRVDDSDDLVPRYQWLCRVGTPALNSDRVGVAHAAALHANSDVARLRLDHLALHQLELALSGDLISAIRRHAKLLKKRCKMQSSCTAQTNPGTDLLRRGCPCWGHRRRRPAAHSRNFRGGFPALIMVVILDLTEFVMSSIHCSATTTSPPEQFVAGLTDFGPGRSKLFASSAGADVKAIEVRSPASPAGRS